MRGLWDGGASRRGAGGGAGGRNGRVADGDDRSAGGRGRFGCSHVGAAKNQQGGV